MTYNCANSLAFNLEKQLANIGTLSVNLKFYLQLINFVYMPEKHSCNRKLQSVEYNSVVYLYSEQKNNITIAEWIRIDAGHIITERDVDDYLDRIQYRGRSK